MKNNSSTYSSKANPSDVCFGEDGYFTFRNVSHKKSDKSYDTNESK